MSLEDLSWTRKISALLFLLLSRQNGLRDKKYPTSRFFKKEKRILFVLLFSNVNDTFCFGKRLCPFGQETLVLLSFCKMVGLRSAQRVVLSTCQWMFEPSYSLNFDLLDIGELKPIFSFTLDFSRKIFISYSWIFSKLKPAH